MPKDEREQKIITDNLNRLVRDSGKTQKEIANRIGVSPQTFNTWCRGVAIPRMEKIQALADYFGVGKAELLEEKRQASGFLEAYVDLLHKDPNYRALLDSTSKMDSEALENLVKFIKGLNPDN